MGNEDVRGEVKEEKRDALWVEGLRVLVLLLYAGSYRLLAGSLLREVGGVVSLSFIVGVPFGFGILSVALGRRSGSRRWLRQAVFWPVVLLLSCLGLCLVLRWEAMICVIMAAPILLLASIAGGLLTHLVLQKREENARLGVALAVLLPLLLAPLEGSWRWPSELKAMENTMVIAATPQRIWQEIASVRAIERRELRERWIYAVGFPRPIAATLDRPGPGGVRTATFERGVSFFETVTVWEPARRLAFTIRADPEFIPHTAFDQHIIVGGRFYDVLDGIYEIEPLASGGCRLHLTSHHRLSTRMNAYAGWWSARIMDQVQGSILEVIRQRAESGAGGDEREMKGG